MSKKDKKLQNVEGPVKSLKGIPPLGKSQSLFGKGKKPTLGLPTTFSSSGSDWSVVGTKRSKNTAKLKITDFPVQVASNVSTSSKINVPSLLAFSENHKECVLMTATSQDEQIITTLLNSDDSALHDERFMMLLALYHENTANGRRRKLNGQQIWH